MIRKTLLAAVLALGVTAAYADAPVMKDITSPVSNEPFNVNSEQWGYQFDNKTGKTVTFVLTVANNSAGGVQLQCFHGVGPIETYVVKAGETSLPCVTDDAIRVVTEDEKSTSAMGTYTITVGK